METKRGSICLVGSVLTAPGVFVLEARREVTTLRHRFRSHGLGLVLWGPDMVEKAP